MKSKFEKVLVSIFILLFLVFAGYILLAFYYRDGFSLNTWINGVYCTGKTVEEVNAELLSQIEAPIVMVTDNDGHVHEFDLAEMDYAVDYLTSLKQFKEAQNPFFWIDNLTFHKNHEVQPVISFDEALLKERFYNLETVIREQQKLTDYIIACNPKSGYQLYDGLSHRMDVDKAFGLLCDSIRSGVYNINLNELDCYYDIPLSQEQKQLTVLWEKIDAFQKCDIVYDMGDTLIEFTPEIMAEFILADEDDTPMLSESGGIMLNETAVETFVSDLASVYDTYQVEREFQSTRGDVVMVMGGTYGTQINQEKEVEFLMENLLSYEMHTGMTQKHIPEYTQTANVRGKNDIGGTYIEVDMTDQKLYFYQDGELVIQTDVVTGNARRRMDTPEGVYFVYNKQEDRVLRGQGYASPVEYWMPVKGAVGIHDANWRSEFGGEIYKTNGSHGCINVPKEIMPDLYENVEIGTPVIIFY